MIGSEDNKTVYRVEFRTRANVIAGDQIRQEARVSLYRGYSGWGDIPQIIAIARGLNADDIVIVSVDLVGLTVDGVQR